MEKSILGLASIIALVAAFVGWYCFRAVTASTSTTVVVEEMTRAQERALERQRLRDSALTAADRAAEAAAEDAAYEGELDLPNFEDWN